MSNGKIWFVTGASSGFGRAMAEYLLTLGYKVVATLRTPSDLSDLTSLYPQTQLLVIQLDVTNPSDVTAAFAAVEKAPGFGRIDVVFNNAGIAIPAEVESIPEARAREIFEINFWGAARVTAEAVRFFREVNKPVGGRLLQVSSSAGLVGLAACGFYCASKFGELPCLIVFKFFRDKFNRVYSSVGRSQHSLADELDPAWNIKVTILEPGPYRTSILSKTHNPWTIPQHPAYTSPTLRGTQLRNALCLPEFYDGDVQKAAKVIERLTNLPLEEVPMRLPLHKGTLGAARGKARGLVEMADKYESWNEDLYHEN